MTYDFPHQGRRRSQSPAFPIPAGPGAGLAALSTPDGPAPRPEPQPDPDDKLVPYERALDMIKNVVVIVTCGAVLYTLWVAYRTVAEFGEQLQRIQL